MHKLGSYQNRKLKTNKQTNKTPLTLKAKSRIIVSQNMLSMKVQMWIKYKIMFNNNHFILFLKFSKYGLNIK